MRLSLVVFVLSCAVLRADTIDGITYNWHYEDVENTSALISVDFSEPITAYSLDVVLQSEPIETQQLWAKFGQVTWTSPNTATVEGSTLPYGFADGVGQIDITVGYDIRYPTLPVHLQFTSLTDPPPGSSSVSQINNPEPASASLIALGLFALLLCRLWLTRRNILA